MITQLRTRMSRLRWKLTWSYTRVAAVSFLIIETVLLLVVLAVLGFNPLRPDGAVLQEIVAPVLTDDIRPITMAYMRNQPVDGAALQADLEQILDLEPLQTTLSPFELERFASVFVLDARRRLVASTPQFTVLPPDGRPFDAALLTGDAGVTGLVTAVYAGDTNLDQPYLHETEEALYLVFIESLTDETGQFLGAEMVIVRTPRPATLVLILLAVILGGLFLFSLAAALIGTLFGWRTARTLSDRLAHMSQVSTAWSQGDFVPQIADSGGDEVGALGENLNRVAADLQTLLADKEQLAVLEERSRMARELHDTLAQGMAGLVLQLEAVKHHLGEGEVAESQRIVAEAGTQAREALRKARAAIDDLRAEALLAPEFIAALSRWAQQFGARNKLAVKWDAQLPDALLVPPTLSLHLRRALAEMLTNVARHAQATTAWVTLQLTGGMLLLAVEDDGVGFAVETAVRPGHYGLIGLKERARLTGGRFTIESAPDEGTTALLTIPMEQENE